VSEVTFGERGGVADSVKGPVKKPKHNDALICQNR